MGPLTRRLAILGFSILIVAVAATSASAVNLDCTSTSVRDTASVWWSFTESDGTRVDVIVLQREEKLTDSAASGASTYFDRRLMMFCDRRAPDGTLIGSGLFVDPGRPLSMDTGLKGARLHGEGIFLCRTRADDGNYVEVPKYAQVELRLEGVGAITAVDDAWQQGPDCEGCYLWATRTTLTRGGVSVGSVTVDGKSVVPAGVSGAVTMAHEEVLAVPYVP